MTQPSGFSAERAVQRYLPLMHEVATRIDLVAHACEGRLNLAPAYAREYAYLQFRRICELVALGCLQLHGDLPRARSSAAQKEWNAEKIMRMLHEDYPHAYPQSVIWERGPQLHTLRANAKPNALTLKQFKSLYAECGEVLHRGTIRSIEQSPTLKESDYQKVLDWQQRIVDLLNEHIVTRSGLQGLYLTSLRTTTGYPNCSILSLNDASGLDVSTLRMEVK